MAFFESFEIYNRQHIAFSTVYSLANILFYGKRSVIALYNISEKYNKGKNSIWTE